MAGKPTRDQQKAISQRRDDALTLKLGGVDLVTIGRKLAADPTVNSDGIAYPQGYGISFYQRGVDPPDEEQLAQLVRDDLARAHRQRRAHLQENLDAERQEQVARIERLLAVAWPKALKGDLEYLDRALRLLDRQARLLGLDAPVRTELSGSGGGPLIVATEDMRAKAIRDAQLAREAQIRGLPPALRALAEGGPNDEDDDESAAVITTATVDPTGDARRRALDALDAALDVEGIAHPEAS